MDLGQRTWQLGRVTGGEGYRNRSAEMEGEYQEGGLGGRSVREEGRLSQKGGLGEKSDRVEDTSPLLRDDQIAELKNRINRSRKICSVKPNGRIVEWSRSSSHTTDTRLLGL